MRALLTGANGTVGRALTARLVRDGATVVNWDRASVAIDRYDEMDRFVAEIAPDVVFHLAVPSSPTGRDNEGWAVTYQWTSELAWICRMREIRFVFTSTAMVFSDAAKGPFTIDSVPDALAGYGHEKRAAEVRVLEQNPRGIVVRLGWQIASPESFAAQPQQNSMTASLDRRAREAGEVRASTRWLPACSFLEDTSDALMRAAFQPGGIYMIDSNTRWSFFEIANALREHLGATWNVVPTEDFVMDQRLFDDRLGAPTLAHRLRALR